VARRRASSTDDHTTLIAFLIMVVTTGGNVVAIRYATRELDPLWAAASRFAVAAAIFAIIGRVLGAGFPRGRALVGALLYGALTFGGFFGFSYWGLRDAPAGLAGVLLATIPLITFGGGVQEGVPASALLAILAGAACAAEAALVVKASPPVHPAVMNAIGMAVGTLILLALMPVFGESYAMPQAVRTWAAQVYLVLVGSVVVFALYLFVLSRWTASAASYEFVLVPLVGIILSAWLLDERVTGTFGVGALLVLVGVYLGALGRPSTST
jgi:drug/metabolite transporter (DMT)-like permease